MQTTVQEVLARELARIQQIQNDSATALIRLNGRKARLVGHKLSGVKGYPGGLYDVIDVQEYTLPAPECVEIVTPNKTMEAGNDLE